MTVGQLLEHLQTLLENYPELNRESQVRLGDYDLGRIEVHYETLGARRDEDEVKAVYVKVCARQRSAP